MSTYTLVTNFEMQSGILAHPVRFVFIVIAFLCFLVFSLCVLFLILSFLQFYCSAWALLPEIK